jgi:cell division protein FtsQ
VSRERGLPWRAVAIGCAAAVALGAAGDGLVHSPLVETHAIAVRGISQLSAQRVLKIAELGGTVNVFFLDTGAIEHRLESDPWIASATVERRLPHTVMVSIRERVPVAAVGNGSGFDAVAADGTVLRSGPSQRGLPLIQAASMGDRGTAAALIGAMAASLRGLVQEIDVNPGGEVSVKLRSGVTVTYGSADDAVAKAQALAAVMQWAGDQGVKVDTIDVSVPTAPTARLAGGATVTPGG